MKGLGLELERGRGDMSEYIWGQESPCDDCTIGCTGGCETCDIAEKCERCGKTWLCSECDVNEDCETCKCNGCEGCPYELR